MFRLPHFGTFFVHKVYIQHVGVVLCAINKVTSRHSHACILTGNEEEIPGTEAVAERINSGVAFDDVELSTKELVERHCTASLDDVDDDDGTDDDYDDD